MRHTEKLAEMLSSVVQTMAVNSVQREERWHQREEQLQTEVTEGYTIIRDMLMANLKADHEYRMRELEYHRTSGERGKLLALMPALANTVAGKEVFPQASADTALIDAIAEKVNPAVIEQLAGSGMLPAEVAGPLTLRLKEALSKREREQEELKRLPPANSDPQKDATGG